MIVIQKYMFIIIHNILIKIQNHTIENQHNYNDHAVLHTPYIMIITHGIYAVM